MTAEDFSVSVLHGDLLPQERESTMSAFRSGDTNVLISTDLIGRGIDVPAVNLVINYDLTTNF
ncbi:MAG: helicase-related protein, partial [Kangiellaceae bacterium]|nr:helicase-related protein [Kangiellaceae bacterium]